MNSLPFQLELATRLVILMNSLPFPNEKTDFFFFVLLEFPFFMSELDAGGITLPDKKMGTISIYILP